jgi:hypothetical protein
MSTLNICPFDGEPCEWGAACKGGHEPWCEREAREVNAPLAAEEDMAPSDACD